MNSRRRISEPRYLRLAYRGWDRIGTKARRQALPAIGPVRGRGETMRPAEGPMQGKFEASCSRATQRTIAPWTPTNFDGTSTKSKSMSNEAVTRFLTSACALRGWRRRVAMQAGRRSYWRPYCAYRLFMSSTGTSSGGRWRHIRWSSESFGGEPTAPDVDRRHPRASVAGLLGTGGGLVEGPRRTECLARLVGTPWIRFERRELPTSGRTEGLPASLLRAR
jgi:hypothetical protein